MLLLFFLMAPLVSTLPIYFLFLLAKVLQAFIFYMLALIYLKGRYGTGPLRGHTSRGNGLFDQHNTTAQEQHTCARFL